MTLPLHFLSCARTETGLVREHNEDALLELPEQGLWAVADGMGGHTAGDVASRMVVDALAELSLTGGLSSRLDAVEDALLSVNAQLRVMAAQRATQAIGSTLVTLLVHERHALCLWVGDSRLYRLRGSRLEQITRDHALVTELLAHGAIDPAQAHDHPQGNLITRAIGAADGLDVDVEIIELADGDLFLLCSDGLDKEVTDDELRALLQGRTVAELPDAMVEASLARGARDNVSVLVVRAETGAAHNRSLTEPPRADVPEPGEDTLPDFGLQEE